MAAVAPAEVGFSAEFVALLFAFLFLWLAITVVDAVRPPVVNLAGAVPLVGGALRGAVESGFGTLRGWLTGYLSQSLVAYGTLLDWLNTLWTAISNIALEGIADQVSAIFTLRTVVIPAASAAVTDWAEGQIASLRAYVVAQVAAAEALGRGLFTVAEQDIAVVAQTAAADAQRAEDAASALAQGLFTVAEQEIATQVAGERAFVVGQLLGVDAQIQTAFAQAKAITAAAEATLQGDIGTVQRELSGTIRQEVDSLLKQIEADKAALSAALAGGLAGVIADVAAIRALRCIQRCAELGALGDALQLFTLAEIFALIEFMLHDPSGFQAAWLSGVQPLVTSTVKLVRSGLGV